MARITQPTESRWTNTFTRKRPRPGSAYDVSSSRLSSNFSRCFWVRIENTIWRICEPLKIGSSVTGRRSPWTRITGDEPHPHLLGERGREVLAPDEGKPQQHGRQRFVLAFRLLDRLLEVVSREHVSVDERLAESSRLVGQHGVVPSEALG